MPGSVMYLLSGLQRHDHLAPATGRLMTTALTYTQMGFTGQHPASTGTHSNIHTHTKTPNESSNT